MNKEHELLLDAHNKIVQGENLVDQANEQKTRLEHLARMKEVIDEKYPDENLDNLHIILSDYPIDSPYCENTVQVHDDIIYEHSRKKKIFKTASLWITILLSIVLGIVSCFTGVGIFTVTNFDVDFGGIIALLIIALLYFVILYVLRWIAVVIYDKVKFNKIVKESIYLIKDAREKDNALLIEHLENADNLVEEYSNTIQTIEKILEDVRAMDIIPEEYIDSSITSKLLKIFEGKEADSIKEAIQIYKRNLEEEKRFAEMQRHNNAMENIAREQLVATQQLNSAVASLEGEMRSIQSSLDKHVAAENQIGMQLNEIKNRIN